MKLRIIALGFLLTGLAGPANTATPTADITVTAAPAYVWNFDQLPAGALPTRWVVSATNRRGSLATWQTVTDKSAPTGDQALALTNTNGTRGESFNLCWTDSVAFADGTVTVQFKAGSGREDQGGGVIWRAQDADNYFVARFNPLEDNFRLYSVLAGVRRTLVSAQITLNSDQWHTMRITQEGEHFTGYLDGQKLVEGASDRLKAPGGVGLWTKADAATSFDNFTVSPASAGVAQ